MNVYDLYDPEIRPGIVTKPYFMKRKNGRLMDIFMKTMLSEGVIRPISKEVMAHMPTFQIPKKDGYRVITDRRRLD